MAGLLRRGLVEEGHAADIAATGEDALWMAAAHAVRRDRPRRDAAGHRRLRDLPPAARGRRLDAGADADRARRGRGPGRRPRRGRRRLPRRSRSPSPSCSRGCARSAAAAAVERPTVLEVGDLRLDPATPAGLARRRARSACRPRSSRCSRRSCAAPARCCRGCSCSSTRGTSPTRTARTSSTSTCATCARRSTARSAQLARDGARRGYRLEADGAMSRLPIRLRLTLVFRAGDGRRARRRRPGSSTCASARDLAAGDRPVPADARAGVKALVARRRLARAARASSLIERGESFAELLGADGRARRDAPRSTARRCSSRRRARARAPRADLPRTAVGSRAGRAGAAARGPGPPGACSWSARPAENRAETSDSCATHSSSAARSRCCSPSLGGYALAGRGAAAGRGDAPTRAGDLDVVARRAAAGARRRRRGRAPRRDPQRDARPDRGRRSSASGVSSRTRATSCARRSRC